MKKTEQLFVQIAGVCAIFAPLILLAADLMQISGFQFEFTIAAWLSFVFLFRQFSV